MIHEANGSSPLTVESDATVSYWCCSTQIEREAGYGRCSQRRHHDLKKAVQPAHYLKSADGPTSPLHVCKPPVVLLLKILEPPDHKSGTPLNDFPNMRVHLT